MPELGTIPFVVPEEGQPAVSRYNDKKAVASVASCGGGKKGLHHRSGDRSRRRWKRHAWRGEVS